MLELYNAGTEQARIITLLIQAKGLDVKLHPYDSKFAEHLGEPEVVISDRGHTVVGAMVISLYLEQRYPSPNLIPQDPQQASIVLMLYRQILRAPEHIQYNEYKTHLTSYDFVAGGRSNLVDVAISALSPDSDFWDRYRSRLVEDWGSFCE
jgi:hypothetical protein